MRGSNSAYEKTKVRQWEEVNLCYNQVQDTNQVKVQGIIDPKPPSRCLPSTQLLTSISSTSPRWSWACPLKCYVSLFKVRLGRGAPYGDFLISNTSRCAVYSLSIIKLIFPLSLRASFFMYPFGIECDPKSKRSSPSSWKSTRQEEFLPSSDRNAKLSQAKPSVLYPFASLQQRIKPGFNVSIAEADYNILSELQ